MEVNLPLRVDGSGNGPHASISKHQLLTEALRNTGKPPRGRNDSSVSMVWLRQFLYPVGDSVSLRMLHHPKKTLGQHWSYGLFVSFLPPCPTLVTWDFYSRNGEKITTHLHPLPGRQHCGTLASDSAVHTA